MAQTPWQDRLSRRFPALLVLISVGIIVYGFGHTVSREFLEAGSTPPMVLVAHALVSIAWLMLLLVQVSLVSMNQVRLHQQLGMAGVALGIVMSVVALITAIELRKLDVKGDPVANLAYLAIPLAAWISFTVPFVLAIAWRARPDRHRPLMIIAACLLAGPALGRIPEIRAAGMYFTGLIPDCLVVAAMLHDRMRSGRWNVVYLCALPLIILLQGIAVYLQIAKPDFWIEAVRWLLSST